MEVLREHDVFERGEIRHKMELLEDEADLFRPVADEFRFVEASNFLPTDDGAAGSGCVESAKNIDEGGFS